MSSGAERVVRGDVVGAAGPLRARGEQVPQGVGEVVGVDDRRDEGVRQRQHGQDARASSSCSSQQARGQERAAEVAGDLRAGLALQHQPRAHAGDHR
ncbi:MAG: hypothetical protein PGN11_16335 [Quadrisphaera sp.]